MTSASELFYNRRSRFGRNSDLFDVGSDVGSAPSLDRTNRRDRHCNSPGGSHSRRNRLDTDGNDPLRRQHRQSLHHRSSHQVQERGLIRHEEGGHQISSGDASLSGNHSNARDRMRFSGNDRLPGPVLLARERLLHRLRSITLYSSRRNNRSSSGNHHNSSEIGDDFRLIDAGDWETEISREWLAQFAPLTESIITQTSQRPPGLTQEAVNCLRLEVFSVPDESDEQDVSRALRECSICLESFLEGDELIHLPCGHRYHFCCLDPWVRSCGDCPYCRRIIDTTQDDGLRGNLEV